MAVAQSLPLQHTITTANGIVTDMVRFHLVALDQARKQGGRGAMPHPPKSEVPVFDALAGPRAERAGREGRSK